MVARLLVEVEVCLITLEINYRAYSLIEYLSLAPANNLIDIPATCHLQGPSSVVPNLWLSASHFLDPRAMERMERMSRHLGLLNLLMNLACPPITYHEDPVPVSAAVE